MKTTLTRLFTVMMLIMVSMGAKADVKVFYGEKGTEKFEGAGGTIEVKQEKSQKDASKITVYLSFIPKENCTFVESSLEVYAVISPDGASTRALEISGDPLDLTEDKSEKTNEKHYHVDIDSKLALWVKSADFKKKDRGAKNPDTPDPFVGTWYIAFPGKVASPDLGYNASTPESNYYLCPTEGWIYYQATNTYTTSNNGQPFLTTFQCRNGVYDVNKAMWTIIKQGDYYQIKHTIDDKYLIYNSGAITNGSTSIGSANRIRVHLESTNTPGENALFKIEEDSNHPGYIFISSKGETNAQGKTTFWLNLTEGNNNSLAGTSAKADGPTGSPNVGNTIGRWSEANNTSMCLLEKIAPKITYNANSLFEITYWDNTATIYYTTNGDDPPTSGSEHIYNGAFSDDDVTMIKAVAVSNGEVSGIATFTPTVCLRDVNKRLIQSQNNPWNTSYYYFYMIPGDDVGEDPNKITKVNTTSLFRPTMEWYFLYGGNDGLTNHYYYVVNSNGKSLCYDATNGVYMDTNSDNADKFKFSIVESPTAGSYNIIPYGLTTGNRFLNKPNGNGGNNAEQAIGLSNSNTNINSIWKFVLPSSLDKTAPFTPSTANISYYKIASVGDNGYYIVPPSGTLTNATTLNPTTLDPPDPEVEKTMNWYFEVAQTVTDVDWCIYYYIRNAVTGEYLYFTQDGNNKGACLEMRSVVDNDKKDRYLFTWARTATENTYYIVPKLLKDVEQNRISSLRKHDSNTSIITNVTRSAGRFAWTFSPSTFQCADPVITYDATQGTATITCATPDAKIYYVRYSDDTGADPDLTGDKTGLTLYDGTPIDMSGYSYIKARAARSGDGTDQSASVSEGPITAFKCATPVIKLSGGNISITCATTVATIYYTVNQEIDTTNPLNTTGIQTYSAPFIFDGESVIRAIAIKGEILSNKSDVATYDKVLHKITKSSAITEMAGNYYFDEGFEDDRTDAIGTDATPFTGTIDGGFHAFSLSHPLIGVAQDATIMNVMISSAEISTTGKVGAIAGEARGYTRIYNCGILPNDATNSNPSTVASTDSYCGGLVGWLKDDSRVVNCFSYANITGGTDVAGIVGHVEAVSGENGSDATVSEGKYVNLRSAVVNCMFYGDITGGSQIYPVYGGAKMLNTGANGINNYNFYRAKASINVGTRFNCSWPASEENLTRFEYYRYLLNSNREICGWWVNSDVAPNTLTTGEVQAIEKDASLIAKWVLDPSIAPYPVLKAPGKYPSVINQDPNKRINPETKAWVDRDVSDNTIETNKAPDTKGQTLGSVEVTIISGKGSNESRTIKITAMDTDNNDFCYGKIQLPYYNEIFGNPNSTTWSEKYGGNYMSSVVTGWDITTTDGTPGTFSDDPITGNIFADRNSTAKDTHRVFAQGGYYYVPYGVGSITITAHWATAYYLGNGADGYYDRVWFSNSQSGSAFAPAGTRSFSSGAFGGKSVNNGTIQSVLTSATAASTVYDCAIVLVGNHQYKNLTDAVDNAKKPFTIMSVDLDFDNEPDYCLEWQVGSGSTRAMVAPVRFDFLPVVELGVAMKEDASKNLFALGKLTPYGHFEVTETSVIHFGQFEYENKNRTLEAPVILNNGVFDQICRGTDGTDNQHISYFLLGGHVKMPSFTPGAHVTKENSNKSRHCAVNVLGGEFTKFYLTGNYNNGVTPNDDDPHCYIDGGKLDMVASAAKEGITGSVYWKIDHAYIGEFYGGGISSDKRVTGNIEIKIDRSKVTKFCGGPMFGDMNDGQTVTTTAIGTTFGVYYGAGNGGTCYSQYSRTENTNSFSLSNYTATKYEEKINNVTGMNGYHAKYEFELVNTSAGTDNSLYYRTYLFAAQFATTNTGDVSNTLTDCTIETNFFGGGNLGGVTGSVTSELKGHTVVEGNAYGAGYSAKDLSVDVLPNTGYTAPKRDTYTAVISDPVYPDPTPYVWTNEPTIGSTSLSTSSPTASSGNIHYLFTEVPLVNLGAVSQNVSLTIGGTSEVHQNVFGGGEESGVDGNTTITLKEGAQIGNNVFGGGNNGVVSGSATVNIE